MKKLGCIGIGNMGGALVEGVVASGLYQKSDVIASCASNRTLYTWHDKGYEMTKNNQEVASNCEVLLLCVKPYQIHSVIQEIQSVLHPETLICSVITGFSLAQMKEAFPNNRVCRAMPNTAVKIRKGYTALMGMDNTLQATVESIFGAVGDYVWLDESKLDGFIGLCGSGIAFGYSYLEAMMEAGIKAGFKADVALNIAAHATMGACEMVMETGEHPAKLKNDVCSPSGTTIEGCLKLEEEGFRHAVHAAVDATVQKARKM